MVCGVGSRGAGGFDIDKVYPVGSIHMSVVETNPSELFGGVWESIQERFLFGAGTTYSAGATGGEATHTLTETEMPSHTHPGYGTAESAENHSHDARNGNSFVTTDNSSSDFSRSKAQTGVSSGTLVITAPDSGIQSSGYSTSSDGSHSHRVTLSISNVESGRAHNNMPPYLAVYMWRGTA